MSSIANSVMPNATSHEPARSSEAGPLSGVMRFVTFPASVCLGYGLMNNCAGSNADG